MRNATPSLSRLGRICHSGLVTLTVLLALATPLPAAQGTETAQTGAAIEISGRIAVGHDQAFIKDAEGYCLVQGHDLTPFAGRFIQAKGLVIGTDQEYRTVRLLEYRILSPDDDSPGAAGAARQTGGTGKKK